MAPVSSATPASIVRSRVVSPTPWKRAAGRCGAGRHRSLHSRTEHFDRVIEEAVCGVRPVFDAFDDSHGRLVHRRVFVCPGTAALKALDTWSELRTVLAVETIRGVNGSGTVEAEIRDFLSSCRDRAHGVGSGDPPSLDD